MAAILIWLASVFSESKSVFLVPLVALASLQFVAFFASTSFAERIFATTDVIYYAIISLAIGLGARYLHELPRLLANQESARFQADVAARDAANAMIPRIQYEVETATQRVARTKELVEIAIDPSTRSRCEAQMIQDRALQNLSGNRNEQPLAIPYPPGCEILLLDDALLNDMVDQQRAKDDLKKTQDQAQSTIAPVADPVEIDATTEEKLLYFWAPMAILLGAMLKLGKSAFAIRKLTQP